MPDRDAYVPEPTHRLLCWAACAEGTTLLLLLFVAVPLKHLADWPRMVSVIGPVHGLAFIAYVWLAINVASGEGWSRARLLRALAAAFVPLGGLFTARALERAAHEARAGVS